MTLNHPKSRQRSKDDVAVAPLFNLETRTIPRHSLPDGEMSPDVAYQIVHDELMLDGNARLNVATFVSTWMEPQAERLMAECLDKNMRSSRNCFAVPSIVCTTSWVETSRERPSRMPASIIASARSAKYAGPEPETAVTASMWPSRPT